MTGGDGEGTDVPSGTATVESVQPMGQQPTADESIVDPSHPTGPTAPEPATALPTMQDLRAMATDLDEIDETLARMDADPTGDEADPTDATAGPDNPATATNRDGADGHTADDGPDRGDGQEPDFAIR